MYPNILSTEQVELFGTLYNAKLLRQQLSYYEDVNYSEKIEYVTESVSDEEIKDFLTKKATDQI